MTRISPKFDEKKIEDDGIEAKIDVYEDRVQGWFFDQARILEKTSDQAGFVILQIALGFIEGFAIYLKGEDSKGHSKDFFKSGFNEIFRSMKGEYPPEVLDRCIEETYMQARCGLFHDGMTRGKVYLSGDFKTPVDVVVRSNGDVVQIRINPHMFLNTVERHFSNYLERLRDSSQDLLRSNFERAWDLKHST